MPRFTPDRFLPSRASRRGMALLSVLWLVALMGILAVSLMSLAKNDSRIAHEAVETAQAEALADAGVFLVIHELSNNSTLKDVPVDGRPRILSIDGNDVTVSVQDENGKIDINFSALGVVKGAMRVAGLSPGDSAAIVNMIDMKRKTAAQDALAKRDAGIVTPPLLPFHAAEELKSMPGMTEDIFQRLRPMLTTYAQSITVQTGSASREVLSAMPGIRPYKIEEIMKSRDEQTLTAADLGGMSSSADAASKGRALTILTTAQAGASRFSRRAVVLITGDAKQPYKILAWMADYGQ